VDKVENVGAGTEENLEVTMECITKTYVADSQENLAEKMAEVVEDLRECDETANFVIGDVGYDAHKGVSLDRRLFTALMIGKRMRNCKLQPFQEGAPIWCAVFIDFDNGIQIQWAVTDKNGKIDAAGDSVTVRYWTFSGVDRFLERGYCVVE